MLRKKLKYDLESIFKVLVAFYGLALFFGLMTRLFLESKESFILKVIGQISMYTFIIMLVGIVMVNILRAWMRFRSDFYGDESYLTHTLPVNTRTLYLSKVISVIITLFVSMISIFLLLLVAFYSKDGIETLKHMIIPLVQGKDSTIVIILLELAFVLFLEILGISMVGYTGIILGHRMNNSKIAYSFSFGFVTYVVVQILAVLGIAIGGLLNKDIMKLFSANVTLDVDMIYLINGLALIIYSGIITLIYFVDIKILNKGINVE